MKENEQICSCGKHTGVGVYSPRERALLYNWYRQRKPNEYNAAKYKYLTSYEAHHEPIGSKEFLFNSSRYKDREEVKAAMSSKKKSLLIGW